MPAQLGNRTKRAATTPVESSSTSSPKRQCRPARFQEIFDDYEDYDGEHLDYEEEEATEDAAAQ